MHYLILFLLIFTTESFSASSQRARQCLTNRLQPGITPTRAQLEVLQNSRDLTYRELARTTMSEAEFRRLEVSGGQAAINRLIRGRINDSRPAVYPKHALARSVRDAQDISAGRAGGRYSGAAQFTPGIIRESIEVTALRDRPGIFKPHGGSIYKYVKFDSVVGYDRGQPTQWMRVELDSNNEYHGHPMGFDRVSYSCRECTQFGD